MMKTISWVLLIVFLFASCSKDWMNIRSDKSQVIPHTLQDYRALLDYQSKMNTILDAPQELQEVGADNYYMESSSLESLSASFEYIGNAYLFKPDVFGSIADLRCWNLPYQRIFHANVVLDGLKESADDPAASPELRDIVGSALFIRANTHFSLAETYMRPYQAATASSDLGIPLRLTSDLSNVSVRATVMETYNQILKDLKEATALLPPTTPYKTRPSRAAAFTLLARTYLSLDDYDKALLYADSSLQLYDVLLDFNTEVGITANYPFSRYNKEVLFHDAGGNIAFSVSRYRVDTNLYNSYQPYDLRKTAFFQLQPAGYRTFKGSYDGSASFFWGISTAEAYLIRAECLARKNKVQEAMNDLNTLLRKRWKAEEFTDLSASDSQEALQLILEERRKELCFRGIRWIDLRRLNRDPATAVTVIHGLNGVNYELKPGDLKYAYPIPGDVIELTGMQQNVR